jgi:hypothetical protein
MLPYSLLMFTTWLETNIDLGVKLNVGKKATALLGLNYFRYNQKIDNDGDNFTDVTFLIEFPFQNGLSTVKKIDCLPLRRVAFMKIVLVAMLGENIVAVTKSMAKAFIPNEQNY